MNVQPLTFNQDFVMSQIKDTKYFYDGTLTICVITTLSDFKIVETSSVVDETKYSKDKGRLVAYEKAISKLFDYCAFYVKTISNN